MIDEMLALTREQLYLMQWICCENKYPIYAHFEPAWTLFRKQITDQIIEEKCFR